jgi:CDP-4-dehydro-6-deoxyglucose reductase, E1
MSYKLASDTWDDEEVNAILRVVRSGKYTMGEEVSAFEDEIASYFNARHAIMTNSGSSANLIALAALKYSGLWNDCGTVIVPAVSWSTTFYPISQLGYKLKFVDISLDTLNIDIMKIEEAIDDNVVGVCGVSLLGSPFGMDSIKQLCEKYNLFLFEDSCESFGAKIKERYAGTFGDVGTLSFFYSHHIQTMEGGMLLTDNDMVASTARSLRAHGWTRDKKSGDLSKFKTTAFEASFEFIFPGYCVRPIEIMAATGRSQLKKWPNMLIIREQNAEQFKKLMERHARYFQIQKVFSVRSSWFGFALILINGAQGKRQLFCEVLTKHQIEFRPIVAGNFVKQSVLRFLNHCPLEEYPNADYIDQEGLFLGNNPKDLSAELALLSLALDDFAGLLN